MGLAALGLIVAAAAIGAEEEPWKRVLKGDDARKAAELQKQINDLFAVGKFAEAVKPAEELLGLRQRVQGEKHWETIDARVQRDTLKHVGAQPAASQQDYVTAIKQMAEADRLHEQERYADAEQLCRRVLAIIRKVLGEQHLLTAHSLNNLARNLKAQGKHTEAETLYRQALAIDRKVLGEQHSRTATCLNNLADNLHAQGRHAEAESLYRRALAIRRKVLGEQHPHTATCLNNLAMNLHAQGKYTDAEPLLRQSLAIDRKMLGEQHPHTATDLNNLAYNLNAQGKYAEAERLNRRALAIRRQALGEQHPHTADSLNNLAHNLDAQGKHAEAEPLYRRALAIHRQALGEQHPHIATCLNNLAMNLNAQGKYAEAERFNRRALAIRRKGLGEQHPDTAQSLNNLALNLDAQSKYAEAEPQYRRALAIRRKVLGEQHPDTALSLQNLAMNVGHQGKHAKAEPLLRQALAIHRQALGEQHPRTATCLYNLAYNLLAQGKYSDAEPLLRQALDTDRKVLGEQHPDTTTDLISLAVDLIAQGKHADAEPLFRAATASFEMARLRISTTGFERAPFGAKHSPFAAFASCLNRLDKPSDAWRAAEAGLARGLLDDLSIRLPPPLDPKQQQRQQSRAARLEQLDHLLLPLLTAQKVSTAEQAQRDTLSRERATLQTELAQDAADLARREVYSLDRIQKQLPADTALVFWIDLRAYPKAADSRGDHWACVVRHSGTPVWFRLPGSGDEEAWTDTDNRLPRRLRDSLANGEGDWRLLARRLYQQRLKSLEGALRAGGGLPAVRRLIVVPAGSMSGIPLETLTDDCLISYAPSGTVYARLREQHRSLRDPSLLALGDPNFLIPIAAAPSSPPHHGVLLTLVLPGGNAHKAGLRAGDVLLRYGDQKLNTFADLKPAASGDPVPVSVWRDGKTLDLRLPAGKLGVALSREVAAEAIRQQRELDVALAARTRDQIKPLPGSRYEVKTVQTLFPRATVLLGSEASELKLDDLAEHNRIKDYRVLHFATHGQMDPLAATRSALLLARDQLPDPTEPPRPSGMVCDGRLTVSEIAAWQLDADLVTLSACETALGPQGGGEGLLGFSQVLLQQGARSLLLSLWKVDDTATALLMTRFYENWLGKRKDGKEAMPKAQALREAKNWLRKLHRAERDNLAANLVKGELRGTVVPGKPVVQLSKEQADMPYAHPRYWAAFILLGDPE
jgi:tetratricopeptide (TPR) repeat protein